MPRDFPTDNAYFQASIFLYFGYMMPFLGKVFAKSYKEYAWLHESAKDFPGMKELKEMFEEVGFRQ